MSSGLEGNEPPPTKAKRPRGRPKAAVPKTRASGRGRGRGGARRSQAASRNRGSGDYGGGGGLANDGQDSTDAVGLHVEEGNTIDRDSTRREAQEFERFTDILAREDQDGGISDIRRQLEELEQFTDDLRRNGQGIDMDGAHSEVGVEERLRLLREGADERAFAEREGARRQAAQLQEMDSIPVGQKKPRDMQQQSRDTRRREFDSEDNELGGKEEAPQANKRHTPLGDGDLEALLDTGEVEDATRRNGALHDDDDSSAKFLDGFGQEDEDDDEVPSVLTLLANLEALTMAQSESVGEAPYQPANWDDASEEEDEETARLMQARVVWRVVR